MVNLSQLTGTRNENIQNWKIVMHFSSKWGKLDSKIESESNRNVKFQLKSQIWMKCCQWHFTTLLYKFRSVCWKFVRNFFRFGNKFVSESQSHIYIIIHCWWTVAIELGKVCCVWLWTPKTNYEMLIILVECLLFSSSCDGSVGVECWGRLWQLLLY